MKPVFHTEPRDPWPPLTPDTSLQEPEGQTEPKKASGDCSEAPSPEQTRRLAKAMMAFTTDLFSQVAQSSAHPNLILSPLSVALALSHLALGTAAAPVQTRRAGRTVGAHCFRVTPPSGSHVVKMQTPGPTSGLWESGAQELGPRICFWGLVGKSLVATMRPLDWRVSWETEAQRGVTVFMRRGHAD